MRRVRLGPLFDFDQVARGIATAAVALLLAAFAKPCLAQAPKPRKDAGMTPAAISLDQVSFADVPQWREDDHLAAWKAFLASCGSVMRKADGNADDDLRNACEIAELTVQTGATQTRQGARRFFESYFRPHVVRATSPELQPGLLTGYYEPVLKGSRTPGGAYTVPVYRRPPDLVNVVAESERGAKSASFTHLRQSATGLTPYPARAEIESGALEGQGLELVYLRDPIDMFFMQVQGSGRIELPDGEKIRITYDGKNGHPYTSIGKVLVEAGVFAPGTVTMQALKKWLRADLKRARPVLWKNESYIFFRELKGDEARGAMGVNNITLQAGRSLAVDTTYHRIGTPIFVSSPNLAHGGKGGFNRLMIAQDVGSAIKGPERGDIYFGSGDAAGRLAGKTKQAGKFYVLLPDGPALHRHLVNATP